MAELNNLIRKVKEKFQADSIKELAKGSAVFFITKVLGIALLYFFTWWVTNNFGAKKWAAFAISLTTLSMLSIFSLMGFDTLTIKHVARIRGTASLTDEHLKSFYFRILVWVLPISLAFGAVLFLLAPTLSQYFSGDEGLRPWFQITALTITPYCLFQLNNSFFCGGKRMVLYGFFANVIPIGATITLFLLLNEPVFRIYWPQYNDSKILLLATYSAMIYVCFIITSLLVTRIGDFLHLETKKYIPSKELWKEGFPLLLAASMAIVINSTDIYMLSYFTTDVEVGIYDVAFKVSLLTTIVLIAVNSIASPKFSEYYAQKDKGQLNYLVYSASKLIFWLSSPILLLIVLFPSFWLSFFGDEFIVGATVLIILSLGQLVNSLSGSVGNLLKMTNYHKLFQNIMIVAVVLNIALNYFLIPIYRMEGAAIASAISVSFINITAVIYAKKKLDILTVYIPFKYKK